MSTLKVDGIRSNSASSDAITLASDGTCTANITNRSNKNKVINGAMALSQRGTSFADSSNYTLDRFKTSKNNDGAITVTQSTTAPDGFANSLKVDVTTADTSIAAGQYLQFSHRIEGRNLQDLAYGTSAAKTITVSFWVRSNVTGTYTFAIQQPDNSSKQVSQTYTIDSANTWEKKTFTFAGDTSGVINNDGGNGFHVYWNVAIGTTWTTGTSRSTWTTYADADFAAGHTVNLLSSTSNEWYLTGVQIEVGSVATDFEHRPWATERRLCQRYYQKYTSPKLRGVRGAGNTDCHRMGMPLLVEMRADPSATWSGTQSLYDGGGTVSLTGISASYPDPASYEFDGTISGTFSNGSGAAVIAYTGGNEGTLELNAEL